MRWLWGLAAALWLVPGMAVAAAWIIDPATRVAVDVGWNGTTVEVRFTELAGTIAFDEQRPETALAEIRVAATSVETGLGIVDALVRSRDYLDASRHPEILFVLDRLERTSAQTADIGGRITMRGITRPVAFKARVTRYGPMKTDPQVFEAGFDLEGTIDRTEFGSTGGLPDVAAVLPVRISLFLRSVPE